MTTLNENDWNFLNDLIFKIHSTANLDEMRHQFMHLIQILIPCDKLTFFLSDSEHFMYAPIQIGLSEERMQAYMDYLWKEDYKKWIFMTGQNKAYRMTDFYDSNDRERQEYYKKAYIPYNIHYEAVLSLAYNGRFVGVVSLYRPRTMTDFTDREIYILEILKKHLAFRLYRELNAEASYPDIRYNRKAEALSSRFHLTPRETEVLRLIAQGTQNACICENLFISASTLKKHTNSIYKKLHVNSKIELLNLISRI